MYISLVCCYICRGKETHAYFIADDNILEELHLLWETGILKSWLNLVQVLHIFSGFGPAFHLLFVQIPLL